METEYLSSEEVAQMLGCLKKRVCTLARAGRIKGERLPRTRRTRGGKALEWFFLPVDILEYQRQERYGQRLVKTHPITASRDDLIWFAGFFDGEGCITIQARKGGGAGWHLSVILNNTARHLIDGMPALFGGSCHEVPQLAHQNRPQARWRASGRQGGLVLRALLPFLRNKRRQALLAIEFQDQVDLASNNGHRPITDEDREWRDAVYHQMHWLNHSDE